MLSNNSNELRSKTKQSGSMLEVRGQVSKHETIAGPDPAGLGRWNYIGLINRGNKVRVTSSCQCVKSKLTLDTMHLQPRKFVLARGIDVCPRKLFILHLTQFASDSMSSRLEVILNVDANEHVVKGKLAK